MYLIDANIVLEVLYKLERWQEAANFLNKVKRGEITAYMLHFTIHAISAILGKPAPVSRFIREITTWRGLGIIETSLEEEFAASENAINIGLDFDDALHYYAAKKRKLTIVSYHKDFDRTDLDRKEPKDVSSHRKPIE